MLNRYLAKTLFKGIGIQRSMNCLMKTAAVKNNYQLFYTTKMPFFDYNNKDKNLFSDDESDFQEEPFANESMEFGGSQGFEEERPTPDVHEGKFDVDEIPLYIFKMRKELPLLRGRGRKQDFQSYFPRFNNFLAMHHQNVERIFAEFPRSSPVFYEYTIARGFTRKNAFLTSLEKQIVESNIDNMPIAGIKNFVTSLTRARRARQDIVKGIFE